MSPPIEEILVPIEEFVNVIDLVSPPHEEMILQELLTQKHAHLELLIHWECQYVHNQGLHHAYMKTWMIIVPTLRQHLLYN